MKKQDFENYLKLLKETPKCSYIGQEYTDNLYQIINLLLKNSFNNLQVKFIKWWIYDTNFGENLEETELSMYDTAYIIKDFDSFWYYLSYLKESNLPYPLFPYYNKIAYLEDKNVYMYKLQTMIPYIKDGKYYKYLYSRDFFGSFKDIDREIKLSLYRNINIIPNLPENEISVSGKKEYDELYLKSLRSFIEKEYRVEISMGQYHLTKIPFWNIINRQIKYYLADFRLSVGYERFMKISLESVNNLSIIEYYGMPYKEISEDEYFAIFNDNSISEINKTVEINKI